MARHARNLSLEQRASTMERMAELLERINRLEGVAGAANVAGGVARTADGSVLRRLPGSAGGETRGALGVNIGSVNVSDPDVDVPRLFQRIGWEAMKAGAY